MLIITAATCMLAVSCSREKDNDTSISDDEAVEAIAQTVSSASGGMTIQIETTANIVAINSLTCGQSKDTSISGQNAPGAAVTYNYSLNFNRTLTCSNGVPSQFQAGFSGHNTYSAPRMSSDDNSTATFNVTGLEPNAASYIFNTSYERNGTQQSKVRFQRSFTSKITITATNITVDKHTQQITSGTASVSFSASGSGGATASRGGTLTFLGGKTATLVLNNGGTYTLTW